MSENDATQDWKKRKSGEAGPSSLLGMARDVAFIVSVYAFFAGFLYQYFYLVSLGIPFRSIDMPIDQILVFAYFAFESNLKSLALAVIIAAAVLIAWFLSARRFKLSRAYVDIGTRALVGVACIVLFPLLYSWARTAQYQTINASLNGNAQSFVKFFIKSDAKGHYDPEFYQANGHSLVVVSESDQYFYALEVPPINAAYKVIPHTYVYAVRKDDISSMKTFLLPRKEGPK